MTKPTRIAALCLGIVFLAGAIFGFVAHGLYAEHTTRASNPQQMRERYISNLQKELALSPGQVAQITSILDETRQRFREIRERMEPEFESLRELQRERIMGILTPEQQPKYQAILEQHRREQERRRQQNAKAGH